MGRAAEGGAPLVRAPVASLAPPRARLTRLPRAGAQAGGRGRLQARRLFEARCARTRRLPRPRPRTSKRAACRAGGDKPAALLGDGSDQVWPLAPVPLRRAARPLSAQAPQLVASRGQEIEALLQRLSDVNDAMSRCAARATWLPSLRAADARAGASAVTSAGDARAHTLARHRDILQEFTQARAATRAAGCWRPQRLTVQRARAGVPARAKQPGCEPRTRRAARCARSAWPRGSARAGMRCCSGRSPRVLA